MRPVVPPLFPPVVSREFEHLRQLGYKREFAAGAKIFSAGDPGDGVYLVETGRVVISATVAQNTPRVLATILPGDCFGEMAALDDGVRSADATAEIPTVATFASSDELRGLLMSDPRMALGLIREFSRRIRNLNQKYVHEIVDEERLAAVGRFASSIVHDFKTPLHIINLALENLRTPPHDQPSSPTAHVRRQVQRMGEMLDELLEFSRPGDVRAALEITAFPAIFQRILDGIRPDLAERGIVLSVPASLPQVLVRVEPRRLERLFTNLAGNAAEAMAGRGTLTIDVQRLSQSLRVLVSDTGPGIAPQIAGRLFQPFATYGKKRGTGLGLSICRKIMEDHGGTIVCDSAPGRGATFIVEFPLGPLQPPAPVPVAGVELSPA